MKREKRKRTKLTVGEVAEIWGCANRKVRHFIHAGELRAINIALTSKVRPVYAIDIADVEAFERKRQVVPSGNETTTQKLRRQHRAGVTDFFATK